jgi:hypothetical protein
MHRSSEILSRTTLAVSQLNELPIKDRPTTSSNASRKPPTLSVKVVP